MVPRDSIFTKRITQFEINVVYECKNLNCSDYFDYINKHSNGTNFFLRIYYTGFNLKHQNEDKPVSKGGTFRQAYLLNLNKTIFLINNWKTIIYKEKRQFLESDYEDSCGYIDNYVSFQHDNLFNYTKDGKIYIVVSVIYFNNNYEEYIEYNRERVSKLTLLANILSLISNIFAGFKFILTFYSSNFNNFKIIEKILNKENIKLNKNKINKIIKLEDSDKSKIMSIKNDLSENYLIYDNVNENDNNIQDKNLNINDYDLDNNSDDNSDDFKLINKLSNNNKRIKKFHFFDFFLNNCYCNCCCKKYRAQEIINMCNKIVYNYASMDNLIKNQILFENLFYEYEWNDLSLNNYEYINLFNQLKAYL